ncbi:hypothetical protein GCM10023350_13040 [Nocardioides endophyticus]|uniref:YbaB/EbfC family DNA-binding protein n=1 Tax=Nocardioides endophyticus TaxID=1353775 RepID=A0ABP8YJY6_9ACTN
MAFGTEVKKVKSFRSAAPGVEKSAGLAGEVQKKSAPVAAAEVRITAKLIADKYELTVEADGQSSTVANVQPAILPETLYRLIAAVSKAARSGELSKAQTDTHAFGINGPRAGTPRLA